MRSPWAWMLERRAEERELEALRMRVWAELPVSWKSEQRGDRLVVLFGDRVGTFLASLGSLTREECEGLLQVAETMRTQGATEVERG